MKRSLLTALLLVACPHPDAGAVTPQFTAFTYQGNLSANGHPASGNFDLTFKLFDAVTGGTQVGSTITMSQFPVVNGAFTTDLDFPGQFIGNQLWIEVAVGGQPLIPRQPVNTVPVAQYALAGNANGVIASAMFVQLGAQPSTVSPGQPLTFSTTVLSSPVITSLTGIFSPPFSASGTLFQLANIGRYEVNYQIVFPTDGGIVLELGTTIPTMAPLPYTMIGKNLGGAVSGSVIVETTTTNTFLSVNAAPGNSVAIAPPPDSSTTNQNATTVSIKQIQ